MSNTEKYRIIQDPDYGYRRLDPIPDEGETTKFYQSQYYDLIRKGERAPDVHKLMAGGEEADRERSWLSSSVYSDILAVLEQKGNLSSKRLLDVGCGTGEFIAFMRQHGWDAVGLELCSEAVAIAKSRGLEVYNLSIEEFLSKHLQYSSAFTVVTLLHVLEHVPNPVELLNLAKNLLTDKGIIVIQVPNDFNELQLAAQKKMNKKPWWIAIPDHINYFDFYSLHALLERLSMRIIYSQGSFPMELFLLMGDDYVGNPEVGSKCHQKRVHFEMSISGELRRRVYRSLAEARIGRDCLVFAEVNK